MRAADTLAGFGNQARVVGGFDSERVYEAVCKVVGDVKLVGIHAVAVGADELDVAKRHQAAGLLIILDALRHHLVAGVVDLHAANGRNDLRVLVVDELVCRQDQLLVRQTRSASDFAWHPVRKQQEGR